MNDAKAVIEAFCSGLGIKSGADTEGLYSFSVDAGEFAIHNLSDKDIVRHSLVQKIIKAYERYENQKSAPKQNPTETEETEE